MDLRRLIDFVRAWLPLMVVTAVLAGTAAYVVSSLQPKVYEARATMMVGQALSAVNPDYTQLLVAQNLASTYAAVAETRPILESLINDLGLEATPDELKGRLQVEAVRDSTLLTITAQDAVPARAAALANTLAEQLIAVSPTIQGREAVFQQSIDQDLAATQKLIESIQARAETLIAIEKRTAAQEAELQTLEGRLVSLRSTYATLLSFSSANATNLLTVVEPAVLPASPVSPRTLLNALMAAAIGLLVVIGVAFLVEQLDDSIKDPAVVQEVTSLSTLGTIARMKGDRGRSEIYQLATLLYPRSGVAEAFRTLRSNVEFASVDTQMRTLLVTSAGPGEGKTVTASNLAVVFAQTGRRVLFVDADLRKPGVHAMFALPNLQGLTTMLRNETVRVEAVAHTTEQANLRVLTTGPVPPNPAELLGSQRMQGVIAQLKEAADLVIFDAPPLQAVADPAVLSSHVDGTLLVIDAARGRRRAARMARETLERAGANTLGAVLNRVPAQTQFGYGGDLSAYHEPMEDTASRVGVAGVSTDRSGAAPGARGSS